MGFFRIPIPAVMLCRRRHGRPEPLPAPRGSARSPAAEPARKAEARGHDRRGGFRYGQEAVAISGSAMQNRLPWGATGA